MAYQERNPRERTKDMSETEVVNHLRELMKQMDELSEKVHQPDISDEEINSITEELTGLGSALLDLADHETATKLAGKYPDLGLLFFQRYQAAETRNEWSTQSPRLRKITKFAEEK